MPFTTAQGGGDPAMPVALRVATVRRERIFQVDDSAPVPLTIVHAPSGFGKTVAAVHHAETLTAQGVRVHWVTCAENFPHATLERLVAEMREPTVVFLDEYERVTSTEVDTALARLLTLTDLLSCVVLARRVDVLAGPVVTSRVDTRIITEADLRFTLEESIELAARHGIVRRPLVTELHAHCDGWPLSISLVLRELTPEASVRDAHAIVARHAHQLCDLLPSVQMRRVFLAATVGEYATPQHIAKLAGVPRDVCLRELTELELFGMVRRTWSADGQRFLGHRGARVPLSSLATTEFGAERVRAWRVEGAISFSAADPVAAFGTLLECEAYADAQRVLTQHFLEMMSGEQTLLHQLRGVPEPHLVRLPVFLATRVVLEQMDPHADLLVMQRLFDALQAHGKSILESGTADGNLSRELVTLAVLSVTDRMRGSAESHELLRRLEANRGVPLQELSHVVPFMYAVAAYTGYVNGDMELAERGYAACERAAKEVGLVDETLRALNGLAATAAFEGRVREAEVLLDRAERHRRETGAKAPQLSWIHRDGAALLVAIEQLDFERAASLIEGVQPMLHRAEQWPVFVAGEAKIRRLGGNEPADADAVFRAAPYLRHMLAADRATGLMLNGDLHAAVALLADLPADHSRVGLAQARLRLLRGEYAKAVSFGEQLAESNTLLRDRIEAQFITAIALWQLDDTETALNRASEVMNEARSLGLRSPLLRLPFSLLQVLAHALAERGQPELGDVLAGLPEGLRYEPFEPLTKAELRTLGELVRQVSVADAAEALFLSPNTVKSHLRSIYRKLRVTKRSEAIVRAEQLGLLTPAPRK